MTSPLPPKRRDSRNLADLIRQDRTRLSQLDRGLVGGHFSPARPVKPRVDSDLEDDISDFEISFINTDIFTTTGSGDGTYTLTHTPLDGSEDVSWHPAGGGGLRLTATQFRRQGNILTVPAFTGLAAGDLIVCEYAYDAAEEPATIIPATATLRAGTTDQGAFASSHTISSLALPTGTVVGDLIALCATSAVTVTDSRLTSLGNGLWVGFATTTGALAVSGPAFTYWGLACITLQTTAVSWGTPALASAAVPSPAGTITVPTVSDVAVAICGITDSHNVVNGYADPPAGYTTGAGSGSAIQHARVDFWTSVDTGTSPAAISNVTGGDGTTTAAVVGLYGRSDD